MLENRQIRGTPDWRFRRNRGRESLRPNRAEGRCILHTPGVLVKYGNHVVKAFFRQLVTSCLRPGRRGGWDAAARVLCTRNAPAFRAEFLDARCGPVGRRTLLHQGSVTRAQACQETSGRRRTHKKPLGGLTTCRGVLLEITPVPACDYATTVSVARGGARHPAPGTLGSSLVNTQDNCLRSPSSPARSRCRAARASSRRVRSSRSVMRLRAPATVYRSWYKSFLISRTRTTSRFRYSR